MSAQAAQSAVDRTFDVLGDATRRRIVERLHGGPASVGELAATLPISRPAVSQHLKVLAQAEIVKSEARGTRRIYRLQARGIQPMRRWLDSIWDEALEAFARHIEKENDHE